MNPFALSVLRFDEHAEDYEHRFADCGLYDASIARFCARLPGPAPRILELGCGPGNVTRRLHHRLPGARILALDLSEAMLERARLQAPEAEFAAMDVRRISSLSGPFDAVVAAFVLPFLSSADARDLLRDTAGLLSPGGHLYLSTMVEPVDAVRAEATSFSGGDEIVFHYHVAGEIRQAAVQAGFAILEETLQPYPASNGSTLTDQILLAARPAQPS